MTDRPRVLVALRPDRSWPPGLPEAVESLAELVPVLTADEVDTTFADITAAFVWDFRSTVIPDAIDRLPQLKWVHVAASGVDASLSDQVRGRGVTFTNARGVTAEAMAEYALALMLAVAKGLPRTLYQQRRHEWEPRESTMLRDQCAVLVGVGAVNRSLAAKAVALGMRVIGVGRRPHPAGPDFERIDGVADLHACLREADYLVVATPLTEETRNLIGPAELAVLRHNAVVLNVGRGAVIDQDALVDALRARRIRAAALDVFVEEPLPADNALWDLSEVVVSPHMSSDFVGWQEAMVQLFLANLRRWAANRELMNLVDVSRGYANSPDDPVSGVPAG